MVFEFEVWKNAYEYTFLLCVYFGMYKIFGLEKSASFRDACVALRRGPYEDFGKNSVISSKTISEWKSVIKVINTSREYSDAHGIPVAEIHFQAKEQAECLVKVSDYFCSVNSVIPIETKNRLASEITNLSMRSWIVSQEAVDHFTDLLAPIADYANEMKKGNKSGGKVCQFFVKGKCKFGNKCTDVHRKPNDDGKKSKNVENLFSAIAQMTNRSNAKGGKQP